MVHSKTYRTAASTSTRTIKRYTSWKNLHETNAQDNFASLSVMMKNVLYYFYLVLPLGEYISRSVELNLRQLSNISLVALTKNG